MPHARLSPSGFHRAAACPGSPREEAKFPDTDNEHSLRGRAAHQVGELCLLDGDDPKEYLGQEIVVTTADDSTVRIKMTEDDIQAVAAYVDYVRLRGQQLGGEPALESKINPGHWLGREDLWGTADCSFSTDKVIEVIDYKHGYGLVEVENNPQLILYAIGVCALRDWTNSDQTETIKMTIVQPRAPHIRGPVRSWEIPAYELFGMLEQLRLQAEATDDPDAPLVPGEKQCQWCKAKATCPALQAQAQAVFAPVEQPAADWSAGSYDQQQNRMNGSDWEENLLRPVEVMDLAAMVKALDNEALVTGWFKSIREHLTSLAKEGTSVPNYKLVHAVTKRKWGANDEDIIKKLMSLRDKTNLDDNGKPTKIKKAEVIQTKPLSITEAEKRLRPRVTDRQWQGVQKMIIKPEGAPVLAPLTDPREPIKSAQEVFEPVTQEQAPDAPGW